MKLYLKLSFCLLCIIHANQSFAQFSTNNLPNDCQNAITACGNSDINLDVSGFGTQELVFGQNCGSQENNSVWIKVTPITNGTLGFTLTPNSTSISEDYDFFVFGPYASCNNIGASSIRCSTTNPQAAGQGNNLTGMNATESDTAEGPGSLGNSFVKWLTVNAGETYYILIDRPIGNSPFSLEWTGTAQFAKPPIDQSSRSGTPLNLENCDITAPLSDGFTSFNLEKNTALIKGNQTDITITYHNSASDANIGINELASPYTNISNPQKIYARITNNNTGCFELTDFDLITSLGPNYNKPSDYIICDNLNDGNQRNGQAIFNLTSKNLEILNGLNPADYNITYHNSLIDAELKNNALPNTYYNSIAFSEQIYVRIEDILNATCKSITVLNLIVNPIPLAYNHTLLQCDEDGNTDGLTVFNLNQANTELTGNDSNLSTEFFIDSVRSIPINSSEFTNTSNPQTIFVKVFDKNTGCFNTAELTLEVSITDSNDVILPTLCDDDGIEDGLHIFNLRDADTAITNSLPNGLTISYYETYNDALLEKNSISDSYTNTIPYSQTIYARVENANNCFGISKVILNVNKLPEIVPNELVYYCLNTYPETISINAGIINDSHNNYTYNWSNGENTFDIQINEPNTYIVTITDANGCSKVRTVIVEASNIATFNTTKAFEVIEASKNNSITVFVSGEGIYKYQLLDRNNNTIKPYQDSNVFNNIPPEIYNIEVKDIKNDCGLINTKVSVIGFPKIFTPNNDGFNDTWQVYGVSDMFQPNTKILIFNRYGKLLKEIDPKGLGWNGTSNGEKLPADDYWFSVKLEDGRVFKNHFTLKL